MQLKHPKYLIVDFSKPEVNKHCRFERSVQWGMGMISNYKFKGFHLKLFIECPLCAEQWDTAEVR